MARLANDKLFTTVKNLQDAYGKYGWHITMLTVLSVTSGILEGIGINALIPFFTLVTNQGTEVTSSLAAIIVKVLHAVHIPITLTSLLILIASLFILKTLAILLFYYVRVRIVTRYEREMRAALFEQTMRASWPYLMKQRTGYLEKTIMIDAANSTNLLSYLTEIILIVTSLTIYTIVALTISPIITITTLIVGAALFLGLKPLVFKSKKIASQEEQRMKGVAGFINESIAGAKTIKALHAEQPIITKADEFFNKFRSLHVARVFLTDITSQTMQLVSILFVIVLFLVSYLFNEFNLVSFAVIIYIIQKIFAYVQSGQNKFHNINANLPFLENVLRYQRSISENLESERTGEPFDFNQTLTFRDVNFEYETNQVVLKGLTASIKRGEIVGIIGPSGAGKTTIVDLLLRLLTPSRGAIEIDGKNISSIGLQAWRNHVGYVSQDIFLINDTIENNIKFFSDISDEQMKKAAAQAHIAKTIEALPEQYKTMVGERGTSLSVGQRQRIVLARVLARNPDILILDEATSALDAESEAAIQKTIEEIRGDVTIIMIAHRISTITNADRLLVIDQGKIKEEGTPKELLANKQSYFYKIHSLVNETH